MKKYIYESFRDLENTIFIGSPEAESKTIRPAHFHQSLEIMYIKSGAIKTVIDNKSFIAEKDDIIFVKKYNLHSYESVDKDSHIAILLGPKHSHDFDFLFDEGTLPPLLDNKSFNKTLLPFFKSLTETDSEDMSIIKKGYVSIILGKLCQHYPLISTDNSAKHNIILKSLNFIEKHYMDDISLESIAKEMGYSTFYFSHCFHDIVGMNMKKYINFVRLNNVDTFMDKNNSVTLTQAVFQSGFKSMATYYRTLNEYKNQQGIKPY